MGILVVTEQGATVRKYGKSLIIEKWEDGKKNRLLEFELIHLDGLLLFGNVQFTTQALAMLMENNVEVSLFSSRGKLRGRIIPPQSKNIVRRILQVETARDPIRRVKLARLLLLRKYEGMLEVGKAKSKNSLHPAAKIFLQKIKDVPTEIHKANSVDTLLGIEGNITKDFYTMIRALIRQPEFRFGPRSYRPPKDCFNALISFLFTLGTQSAAAILEAMGLDPYLGFLHSLRYGRVSLALDILEEFRSELVSLALTMVNRRQLTTRDFNAARNFFLKKQGLKKVLNAFSTYLEEKSVHYRMAQASADIIQEMQRLKPES
ncbi:MAG: CRISPR-associated endonuclease Cas1 [Candidatus Hydrogenedentota bacterium]|nr:MAG: CRISPR-associated endonuclease Cas1 [Candidatus Hydrogenedentota bacterium]